MRRVIGIHFDDDVNGLRLGLGKWPALKKHVYVTPVTAVNLTCSRPFQLENQVCFLPPSLQRTRLSRRNGNDPGPTTFQPLILLRAGC